MPAGELLTVERYRLSGNPQQVPQPAAAPVKGLNGELGALGLGLVGPQP